jgi:hypothetical protein
MPLTWDTQDVLNYEDVCWITSEAGIPDHGIEPGQKYLNPVTNALIWHSLNTGIGRITEVNAAEVYARIALVETLYGASLRNSDGPRPITMDDVLQHVGLTTNATFQEESRTKFLKRHADYFLTEKVAAFKKATKAKDSGEGA